MFLPPSSPMKNLLFLQFIGSAVTFKYISTMYIPEIIINVFQKKGKMGIDLLLYGTPIGTRNQFKGKIISEVGIS